MVEIAVLMLVVILVQPVVQGGCQTEVMALLYGILVVKVEKLQKMVVLGGMVITQVDILVLVVHLVAVAQTVIILEQVVEAAATLVVQEGIIIIIVLGEQVVEVALIILEPMAC